jgi:hypothetical protein
MKLKQGVSTMIHSVFGVLKDLLLPGYMYFISIWICIFS